METVIFWLNILVILAAIWALIEAVDLLWALRKRKKKKTRG